MSDKSLDSHRNGAMADQHDTSHPQAEAHTTPWLMERTKSSFSCTSTPLQGGSLKETAGHGLPSEVVCSSVHAVKCHVHIDTTPKAAQRQGPCCTLRQLMKQLSRPGSKWSAAPAQGEALRQADAILSGRLEIGHGNA